MAEGQTEEAGVAARPADYKPRAKVLYEETARKALLDEFNLGKLKMNLIIK